MGWCRGYKVVNVVGRKLKLHYGSVFSEYLSTAKINYIVKEIAKPHLGCGPLALFKKEQDALRWWLNLCDFYTYKRYKIFKCQYRPSKQLIMYCQIGLSNSKVSRCQYIQDAPEGTVLATQVRLLEEIPLPTNVFRSRMSGNYVAI
jgi:hypothetical protein